VVPETTNTRAPSPRKMRATAVGRLEHHFGYHLWPVSEDVLEAVVFNFLAQLQDDVIEEIAFTGWPPSHPSRPDAPQRADELPAPYVAIHDGVLQWGYGDEATPALALEPIRLDDFELP